MNTLVIEKQTGGYFKFTLNGDTASAITSIQNDLLAVGTQLHFKTGNGANIIKEQFIYPADVTIIASGTFTFTTVAQVWDKLIEIDYFAWLGGGGTGGVDRFDDLLDTFSYTGNAGKAVVVDGAELRLVPITLYNKRLFTELEDTPSSLVPNKMLVVNPAGTAVVLQDQPEQPEQLLNSVGYFDYNDLATQTIPLNAVANVSLKLTNDTEGLNTSTDQNPYGVSYVWDYTTNQFNFSELEVGDTIDVRVHVQVTTTTSNQKVDLKAKLGIGSASEFTNTIYENQFKTAGLHEVNFVAPFYMGSTDITDYPAELYLTTDASATVKVDGWYVRILRKNINIITVDYTVPDATTTVKGIVRLAGDLAGTANSPTVPELANKVPTSRTVSTTSPLLGGGALSSNLTLSIQQANSVDSGYLSNVDWSTFNGKANDSAVVHKTGDETISGVKTFSNPTIFNSSLNIASGAYSILYNPANSAYWQTYVDSSNVFNFGYNGNVVKASISNSGNFTANSFIKSGGTSLQFLKADGTVDSTTYANDSVVVKLTGDQSITGSKSFTTNTAAPAMVVTNNSTDNGILLQNTSTGNALRINNGALSTGDLIRAGKDGNVTFIVNQNGNTTAASFIKSGGTSLQFLKADGTVDSSTYLTSLSGAVLTTGDQSIAGNKTFTTEARTIFQNSDAAQITFKNTSDLTKTLNIGHGSNGNIFSSTGLDFRVGGLTSSALLILANENATFKENLTAKSFIKSGGTGVQILAANGDIITAGTNITISGGLISTSVSNVSIGTNANGLSVSGNSVLELALSSASATGALSSTDYQFFYNKQNALTNPVTGTGDTNYIPKFTGASAIGNSLIYDNGTNVLLGSTSTLGLGNVNFLVKQTTALDYEGISVLASTNNNFIALSHTGTIARISSNYGTSGSYTPLALTTSGIDRLYITSGGNVGIGTTSPVYKFHVNDTSDGVVGHFSGGVSNYTLISFKSNEPNVYSTSLGSYNSGMLFRTGATDRMYINSSGNVGIGTTSPNTLLEVASTTSNAARIRVNNTSTTAGQYRGYEFASGSTFKGGFLQDQNTDLISIFTPFGGQSVNITSGGNVGIGTSSPGGKLHVVGEVIFDDGTNGRLTFANGSSQNDIYSTTTSFGGWKNLRLSSNELILSSGGTTERMRITSGGNVGIGTTSPSQKLDVHSVIRATNTSSASFQNAALELFTYNGTSVSVGTSLFSTNSNFNYGTIISNQTNLYGVRDGGIRIATGIAPIVFSNGNADIDFASERMRITSGGNVGIGTTSPGTKLDVKSNIRLIASSNTASAQIGVLGFGPEGYGGINTSEISSNYEGAGWFNGSNLIFKTSSSGDITANPSVERMRITSGGNVLIGTTTDAGAKLQVSGGNGNGIRVEPNGGAVTLPSTGLSFSTGYGVGYIRNANSSGTIVDLYVDSSNVIFSNTVTATAGFFNSDIRLKDLTDYDYNVSDIKPITYLWKDGRDDKKHIGYSAQEVQKVMPDAVNETSDGMLSVNYVEVLVAQVELLNNRMAEMQKEIELLKYR